MKHPRKLIEVALPLDDINAEAGREKSIRHGHPSTLHLWWARRPLAAARAVWFAQLVNDPGGHRGWGNTRGQSKDAAAAERERLFDLLRELVRWENVNNPEVLERARAEIRRSWEETCRVTGEDPAHMPPALDPFAGGGTIPLEAQRLGLEAWAADLNPVAVTINKALIEIPPRFAGRPPVGPLPAGEKQGRIKGAATWTGAAGLAEDVRRYGAWIRDKALERIGHLYPDAELPPELGGGKATVIAWLWCRTVATPNPAFHGKHVPLVSTFWLSRNKSRPVWLKPVVDAEAMTWRFDIMHEQPDDEEATSNGTKMARGANFRCLLSGVPIEPAHIKAEGFAGRLGVRLMAVVLEGRRQRVYIPPTPEMEELAASAKPTWVPTQRLPDDPRNFWTVNYGLNTFGSLFTSRQLHALNTFADLVQEAQAQATADALKAGWKDDDARLEDGGDGARAYGEAVGVYLAFALDKVADRGSSLCTWFTERDSTRNTFARQALPMTWDFAELNVLLEGTGSFVGASRWTAESLEGTRYEPHWKGTASQRDAASEQSGCNTPIISTDPPYYDNIGYADLSDFFYVWLRRTLQDTYPSVYGTMLVPKDDELVATPYRHGGKEQAETFFMEGMTRALANLAAQAHEAYPVTIYYAFKQSETKQGDTTSTGWETFLEAVIRAGFMITGTWPLRTELGNRLVGMGNNALASSIVLACRRRPDDAEEVGRREFLRELEAELVPALGEMMGSGGGASPIAPVDLAQAAIGPGMAVYSRYGRVLDVSGAAVTVREALASINRVIDKYFDEAEGELDADTRFCVGWFQEHGFKAGEFGRADVLARAKGTSVEGVAAAGVVEASGGKVRLLKVSEYPSDWSPESDARQPVWEKCHHLCRALSESEAAAGALLGRIVGGESVRQLAYRLYTLCERRGWAAEARWYNDLIQSWHALAEAAAKGAEGGSAQGSLNL